MSKIPRNTPPQDSFDENLFSEQNLDLLADLEFLPLSCGFEHLMYDYRLKREATFHCEGEIDLGEQDPLDYAQFAPELADWFANGGNFIIKNLSIAQTETVPNSLPQATFSMSFQRDTTHYRIDSDGYGATLEASHLNGNTAVSQLTPNNLTGFMKIIFLCLRHQHDSDIDLPDDALPEILRDAWIRENEQLIMVLGNFIGVSDTETVALFPTDDDTSFLAVLRNRETNLASQNGSDFNLEKLSDDSEIRLRQLDSLQRFDQDRSFWQKMTARSGAGQPDWEVLKTLPIDAETESLNEEWMCNMVEFMNLIQPLLKRWRYLDASPDEISLDDPQLPNLKDLL